MLNRLIVYNSGYQGSLLITKIISQPLNIVQAGGDNIINAQKIARFVQLFKSWYENHNDRFMAEKKV